MRGVWLLGVAALFIWAAVTLARRPVLGVANNGDYDRVIAPAGLTPVADDDFTGQFVLPDYHVVAADLGDRFNSTALLAWLAKPLPGWTMDLRAMGLFCLAALAAAFVVAWRSGVHPALLLGAAWIVVDPGYLLFLNSFFADIALLLALPSLLVWFARFGAFPAELAAVRGPRALAAWGVLAAISLCAGLSKVQHAVVPLLVLIVVAVALRQARPRWSWRHAALAALFAAMSVLCPLHFTRGGGPRFDEANNFNAVFNGIARFASDRRGALAALDFPHRHEKWIGKSYFVEHPPKTVEDRLVGLSRLRIALMYLGDPAAMVRVAGAIQKAMTPQTTHAHGSYERGEGDGVAYSVPWQISKPRAWALGGAPWLVWIVLAVAFWRALRRRPPEPLGVAVRFLVLYIVAQMVVVILGEGDTALMRHLLGARLAFDFLCLLGAAALVRRVASSRIGWPGIRARNPGPKSSPAEA